MKKLGILVAVLAFVMMVTPTFAKNDKAKGPVEKATGSVGYEAVGLQR